MTRDQIVGIGHVMTEIASVLGRIANPEALSAAGGVMRNAAETAEVLIWGDVEL